MKKTLSIALVLSLIAVTAFANGNSDSAAADDGQYKMVLLVKSLGNGFFEACDDGAQEAAAEL
ncbi:MAG: rhamnose ABC transporter substrate-binding protein, partial [Spirochaetaceae bacterium]|nr:rhamnose ABC transporter substrate-binding protein [Spirochaetaceae bacterium]